MRLGGGGVWSITGKVFHWLVDILEIVTNTRVCGNFEFGGCDPGFHYYLTENC